MTKNCTCERGNGRKSRITLNKNLLFAHCIAQIYRFRNLDIYYESSPAVTTAANVFVGRNIMTFLDHKKFLFLSFFLWIFTLFL